MSGTLRVRSTIYFVFFFFCSKTVVWLKYNSLHFFFEFFLYKRSKIRPSLGSMQRGKKKMHVVQKITFLLYEEAHNLRCNNKKENKKEKRRL